MTLYAKLAYYDLNVCNTLCRSKDDRVHIWQLRRRLQSRTGAGGSVTQVVSRYSGFANVVDDYGKPGGSVDDNA